MQTLHSIIGSMIDESESGEAYDKLADQQQRLAPRESRPPRRKQELSIELEARLVRAAMSNNMTLKKLTTELGIRPSLARTYIKQLGLEKIVSKTRTVPQHRTHGAKRVRQTLTH